MKILKLLAVCTMGVFASAAHSATIFEPTDGDVNLSILKSVSDQGYTLAIFDDAATINGSGVITGGNVSVIFGSPYSVFGQTLVGGLIDFTGSPSYLAVNTNADSLALAGGNSNFIVGLCSAGTCYADDGSGTAGWPNTFTLGYSVNESQAYAVDVKVVPAVPVPAAAWLFGSGLIGLVGVARRRA